MILARFAVGIAHQQAALGNALLIASLQRKAQIAEIAGMGPSPVHLLANYMWDVPRAGAGLASSWAHPSIAG
jgi:hypothetical protein